MEAPRPRAMLTRLLLIDDDDLSREVLTLLLSEDGFAVDAHTSGDIAVAHLAQHGHGEVDAVLTDLQMPGLHGAALARELRIHLPPRTPLLVMSGSTPSEESLAPFDGFLPKPLAPHELRETLTILDRARPSRTATDPIQESAETAPASDPAVGHAADPAPTPRPVLDEDTFRNLAALMKPAQLRDLLTLSLSEIDRNLAALHRAQAAGDDAALRAAAHTIKGGVAMIGARELEELAAHLEQHASPRAERAADQAATLREIEAAADRLRRMLVSRGMELS